MKWLIGLWMLLLAGVCQAQGHTIYSDTSVTTIPGFYVSDSVKYISTFPWLGAYAQPAAYADWWKDMQHCAGLPDSADFSNVTFLAVNTKYGFSVLDPVGKPLHWKDGRPLIFDGLSDQTKHVIILPIGRVLRRADVAHEMLHVVLARYGLPHGHGDIGVTEAFQRCHINEFADSRDNAY